MVILPNWKYLLLGFILFSSIRYLGNRFPRGKPNLFPAAWESWPMTGSREFTRPLGPLDRPGGRALRATVQQGFVGRGFSRDIQESDKLGL